MENDGQPVDKRWKHDWKNFFRNKSNKQDVIKTVSSNNPAFIMRNHLVEQIIQELLIDKRDTLNKSLACIERPFEKISHYENMYVSPTKEHFEYFDADKNEILTWSEWKSLQHLR